MSARWLRGYRRVALAVDVFVILWALLMLILISLSSLGTAWIVLLLVLCALGLYSASRLAPVLYAETVALTGEGLEASLGRRTKKVPLERVLRVSPVDTVLGPFPPNYRLRRFPGVRIGTSEQRLGRHLTIAVVGDAAREFLPLARAAGLNVTGEQQWRWVERGAS